MNYDITALRVHLFDALQGVKDGTLDLDKARTINEISKTITDTAKVEVDFLRATGNSESAFIKPADSALPNGITGVVRHSLAG